MESLVESRVAGSEEALAVDSAAVVAEADSAETLVEDRVEVSVVEDLEEALAVILAVDLVAVVAAHSEDATNNILPFPCLLCKVFIRSKFMNAHNGYDEADGSSKMDVAFTVGRPGSFAGHQLGIVTLISTRSPSSSTACIGSIWPTPMTLSRRIIASACLPFYHWCLIRRAIHHCREHANS